MSNYATADSFKKASERRFAEHDIAGVGTICVRSLNGFEFGRIKSAVQKAVLAAQSDKKKAGVQAESVAWVMECVVHPESKEPLFTNPKDVEAWDSGLLEYVAQLCADHCDYPGLEEAAKN